MSIFVWDCNEQSGSPMVDSIDIVYQNTGNQEFDMLIQGNQQYGPIVMALRHVYPYPTPGSLVQLPLVPTNNLPFQLMFITNADTGEQANITIHAKHGGETVSLLTRQQLARWD